MRKIIFCSVFLFLCAGAYCQQEYTLKKPLSKGDLLFLKQQLRDYNFFDQQLNFEFQNGDFTEYTHFTDAKPFDPEEIKKLKAKLKGDCEDAAIYYDIGMAYKFNYNYEEARVYLDKSLEKAKQRVVLKPDSASAYQKLASVYLGLENFQEAIAAYKKAFSLDEKDTYSKEMYISLHYNTGDYGRGDSLILEYVRQYPDSFKPYALLPVYYLINFFSQSQNIPDIAKRKELFKNKKAEELMDLSLIKIASEKNSGNPVYELIYRVSELIIIMGKSVAVTDLDTNKIPSRIFELDETDKKAISRLDKFFQNCLSNKKITNQYPVRKALTILAVLKMNIPEAKKQIKEAIKIKESRSRSFYSNPIVDYGNLAAICFLDKDTISIEKILLEKIEKLPGINPAPDDYVKLAQLNFYYGRYEKAKEYAGKALKIIETMPGANLCLSSIAMAQNDLTGALEPLKREQQIAPDSFSFLIVGGIYSLFTNDTDVAAACFREAQKQSQNPSEIQRTFVDRFLAPVKK